MKLSLSEIPIILIRLSTTVYITFTKNISLYYLELFVKHYHC